MNESSNTYELIEKYCLDLMDEQEQAYFESDMQANPALKKAVEEYRLLLQTFDHAQNSEFIHRSLDSLHLHSRTQTEKVFTQLRLHVNKYWRTASVAASVAFLASILTFVAARSVYKKDTHTQYLKLRNEINTIKKNQADIASEVDHVKKSTEVPDEPSKYSGTGFALSQNGYLVTNLHVIEGYDKIFVFTQDNVGHQGEVVVTDEVNDLAILRIKDQNFTFPSRVPYSVRKANLSLAQRVYTLGYPKSDIVYSEGYISSITGFEGDSSQYQLELPSVPGISGSPIIDETGNVVGIVSGKQSLSEGITYAVRSKALLNLIKDLPMDFAKNEINNNLLKGQTRANQVKNIQPCVCVVKVYN